MDLIALAIGIAIGATFAEAIRATWRKVTKGRFFGPVPAKDETPPPPAKG